MKTYYGCLNYYHNNCKIKSITAQHVKKELQTDLVVYGNADSKNIKWLPNILYSCIVKYVVYPFNNYQKSFKN